MIRTWIILAGSLIANAAPPGIIPSPAEAGPAVTATVRTIRYSSGRDHTRVVIELDSDAPYETERITGPERIFFDISGAMVSGAYLNRTIPVGDPLLKRVRVAQNSPEVVRVVLDISEGGEFSVLELRDPFRIVIDIYSRAGSRPVLDLSPQAPGPHPDGIAVTAAPEQVPGAGLEAKAVPQPAAPHEAPETASSVAAVEPEIQPAGPEVNQTGSARAQESSPRLLSLPPEIVGTSSQAADQTTNGTGSPPAQPNAGRGASRSRVEGPLTVTGSLSSGFYSSYTRGGGNENQSIRFVPASAIFDINGYYLTPDLLDYWVQPELNAGPQASDAGFQGGNGLRLRATALRRVIPLTFRYSNVQLKDAYFGSLSQVSSYTRQNHNKEIGLSSELKHAGLPTVTLDWGNTAVDSRSGMEGIPDYHSHANHLNLGASYQRAGWDFQGSAGRQQQASDLLTPSEGGFEASLLSQKIVEYQMSARRSFLEDSELYVDAGNHSTSNLLLSQAIDLTSHYASASLRMFQRRRFRTTMRAGYTSNVAGLWLSRLVGGLAGSGSIAPESGVLLPFQHTVSYLNLNGLTSMDLSHGFGLYSSLDRTSVLRGSSSPGSRYLTTAGGVTYAGSFGWGSLSGQYGRLYGIGSGIGETGRIRGQSYLFTAQPGKRDGIQFDFSIRGTDQYIINMLPADEHSFSSEGSVGFNMFGPIRIQLGGGWQKSTFTNAGNDFHTEGFSARAGIEHSRFQLNGSLNSSVGNSLQESGLLGDVTGGALAWLTPLQLNSSDLRGITLALHALPLRRLELSALWTRSIQHLEGIVDNDFEIIDVYVTFHFRKLQIGAGFFRSSQIYTSYLATYPETERGRLYFRIVRTIKIL